MVGLYYSSLDVAGFEYDLIAQFQKSKDWVGNLTGPYVSDEIALHSNRIGAGFVVGMRTAQRGTFAAAVTAYEENQWHDLSTFEPGVEAKLSLFIVGLKVGSLNWDKSYFEVGFSF